MVRRNDLLGVDIGGTKVAMHLEQVYGPQKAVFDWANGGGNVDADLALFADQVRMLVDNTAGAGTVGSVGVAIPATLDRDGRVVTWPGRPSWVGVDLGGILRELFPDSTVRMADDGDLAALAEADAAGVRDLVYLGVGTGIGGGIVLDGAPVPGWDRGSCEVGHMVVDRSGPTCDCGRAGCVQALASGPATLRRATDARGAPTDYPELADAWRTGVEWAVQAVDQTCAVLALAIVSLTELVRPSAVVVGGGFAAGLTGFVDTLTTHVRAAERPGHPAPPVRAAALGGLSSLHGAVRLAKEGRAA